MSLDDSLAKGTPSGGDLNAATAVSILILNPRHKCLIHHIGRHNGRRSRGKLVHLDKVLFRYRLFTLTIFIIAGLLMTACGAIEKAELAGMEAAAGAVGADTLDGLLRNFTENTLFCGAPGAVLKEPLLDS